MKRLVISIAAVLSITTLSACGSSSGNNGTNAGQISATPTPIIKNYLTGLQGINGPILAVKVDDTSQAHPQIGLQSADVIYVEQVEGGLTRLAAIYSQNLPDLIGPVRSARISDIEILAQYGRVGFAFSGAQSKFYPKINSANLVNLSADRNSAKIYFRDSTRFAPTNLILRPRALMEQSLNQDHSSIDTVKPIGFTFGALGTVGKPITSMKIKWPASTYGAIWSASESRWLLSHDGKPDLASTGENLGSPTIIIQKVSITPSEYHDRHGGVTPFSNTVGTGSAYLLREGYVIPITWSRPTATSGTVWNLPDGTLAQLVPGQIWIMLTDQTPIFTYPVIPSASTSASK